MTPLKTKTFIHKLTGVYKTTFSIIGLFQQQPLEDTLDESDIDLEINRWLESNPDIEVIEIKQSTSRGSWIHPIPYVTTSIWYKENS